MGTFLGNKSDWDSNLISDGIEEVYSVKNNYKVSLLLVRMGKEVSILKESSARVCNGSCSVHIQSGQEKDSVGWFSLNSGSSFYTNKNSNMLYRVEPFEGNLALLTVEEYNGEGSFAPLSSERKDVILELFGEFY